MGHLSDITIPILWDKVCNTSCFNNIHRDLASPVAIIDFNRGSVLFRLEACDIEVACLMLSGVFSHITQNRVFTLEQEVVLKLHTA